mmetsp:Transcript_25451/g.41053  ORF Transcript_25451/g.41053 Transcript_25451/m.41053 type:complete len:765 (+) Transcript_25451:115-2409(+)
MVKEYAPSLASSESFMEVLAPHVDLDSLGGEDAASLAQVDLVAFVTAMREEQNREQEYRKWLHGYDESNTTKPAIHVAIEERKLDFMKAICKEGVQITTDCLDIALNNGWYEGVVWIISSPRNLKLYTEEHGEKLIELTISALNNQKSVQCWLELLRKYCIEDHQASERFLSYAVDCLGKDFHVTPTSAPLLLSFLGFVRKLSETWKPTDAVLVKFSSVVIGFALKAELEAQLEAFMELPFYDRLTEEYRLGFASIAIGELCRPLPLLKLFYKKGLISRDMKLDLGALLLRFNEEDKAILQWLSETVKLKPSAWGITILAEVPLERLKFVHGTFGLRGVFSKESLDKLIRDVSRVDVLRWLHEDAAIFGDRDDTTYTSNVPNLEVLKIYINADYKVDLWNMLSNAVRNGWVDTVKYLLLNIPSHKTCGYDSEFIETVSLFTNNVSINGKGSKHKIRSWKFADNDKKKKPCIGCQVYHIGYQRHGLADGFELTSGLWMYPLRDSDMQSNQPCTMCKSYTSQYPYGYNHTSQAGGKRTLFPVKLVDGSTVEVWVCESGLQYVRRNSCCNDGALREEPLPSNKLCSCCGGDGNWFNKKTACNVCKNTGIYGHCGCLNLASFKDVWQFEILDTRIGNNTLLKVTKPNGTSVEKVWINRTFSGLKHPNFGRRLCLLSKLHEYALVEANNELAKLLGKHVLVGTITESTWDLLLKKKNWERYVNLPPNVSLVKLIKTSVSSSLVWCPNACSYVPKMLSGSNGDLHLPQEK